MHFYTAQLPVLMQMLYKEKQGDSFLVFKLWSVSVCHVQEAAAGDLSPACQESPAPDVVALRVHLTVLPTSALEAQTYQTSETCHGIV